MKRMNIGEKDVKNVFERAGSAVEELLKVQYGGSVCVGGGGIMEEPAAVW